MPNETQPSSTPLARDLQKAKDTMAALNNAGSAGVPLAQPIALEDIVRESPHQRIKRTPEAVRQMAQTIEAHGLLAPIVIRPDEQQGSDGRTKYTLVAGHRRFLAFQQLLAAANEKGDAAAKAKYARIPAVIKFGLTELEAATLTALENLERNDGTVLEQAAQVAEVRSVGGFKSNEEVAKHMGLTESTVQRLLSIHDAAPVIREALQGGLMVETTETTAAGEPKREHRQLPQTAVPAATRVFKAHFAVAHASVSAKAAKERAKAKKPAKLDDESKQREKERIHKGAMSLADDKTREFLTKGLQRRWTAQMFDTESKALAAQLSGKEAAPPAEAADASNDGGGDGSSADATQDRAALYRDKGDQFVLYPKKFARASPDARLALAAKLESLAATLRASAPTEGEGA